MSIFWIGGRGGRKVKTKEGGSAMISPEMDQALKKMGITDSDLKTKTKEQIDALRRGFHPLKEKPPTKAEKTTTSNPIKDTKEFDQELQTFLKDYSKKNPDKKDLIPIYEVRRHFGDRVSRQEFDDLMLEFQGADKFQLIGGQFHDITAEKARDSSHNALGAPVYYIATTGYGTNLKNKVENRALTAPKKQNTSKITSQKDFETQLLDVAKQVDKDFPIYKGTISLSEVKNRMKGKMSDSQFNDWLFEAQGNGKIQLISGRENTGVKNMVGQNISYLEIL